MFKVKVTVKFQNSNECLSRWCVQNLTSFFFPTELGMVLHYYEPDGLPKRLVCCLQGQGHNEGSYYKNMTF